MFKKILIALDHSKADDVLLPKIKELARLTQADILLFHVSVGWVARWQKKPESVGFGRNPRGPRIPGKARQGTLRGGLSRHPPPRHRGAGGRNSQGCARRELRPHRYDHPRPPPARRPDSWHHYPQSPPRSRHPHLPGQGGSGVTPSREGLRPRLPGTPRRLCHPEEFRAAGRRRISAVPDMLAPVSCLIHN